jgi:hypothetical protein
MMMPSLAVATAEDEAIRLSGAQIDKVNFASYPSLTELENYMDKVSRNNTRLLIRMLAFVSKFGSAQIVHLQREFSANNKKINETASKLVTDRFLTERKLKIGSNEYKVYTLSAYGFIFVKYFIDRFAEYYGYPNPVNPEHIAQFNFGWHRRKWAIIDAYQGFQKISEFEGLDFAPYKKGQFNPSAVFQLRQGDSIIPLEVVVLDDEASLDNLVRDHYTKWARYGVGVLTFVAATAKLAEALHLRLARYPEQFAVIILEVFEKESIQKGFFLTQGEEIQNFELEILPESK